MRCANVKRKMIVKMVLTVGQFRGPGAGGLKWHGGGRHADSSLAGGAKLEIPRVIFFSFCVVSFHRDLLHRCYHASDSTTFSFITESSHTTRSSC